MTQYEKAHADVDVKLLALYVDGFVNMPMVKEPVDPLSPTADHKVKLRIPPPTPSRSPWTP